MLASGLNHVCPANDALGSNDGAIAANHSPNAHTVAGSDLTSHQSTQNYSPHMASAGPRADGLAQQCHADPLTGPQNNNSTLRGKY